MKETFAPTPIEYLNQLAVASIFAKEKRNSANCLPELLPPWIPSLARQCVIIMTKSLFLGGRGRGGGIVHHKEGNQ